MSFFSFFANKELLQIPKSLTGDSANRRQRQLLICEDIQLEQPKNLMQMFKNSQKFGINQLNDNEKKTKKPNQIQRWNIFSQILKIQEKEGIVHQDIANEMKIFKNIVKKQEKLSQKMNQVVLENIVETNQNLRSIVTTTKIGQQLHQKCMKKLAKKPEESNSIDNYGQCSEIAVKYLKNCRLLKQQSFKAQKEINKQLEQVKQKLAQHKRTQSSNDTQLEESINAKFDQLEDKLQAWKAQKQNKHQYFEGELQKLQSQLQQHMDQERRKGEQTYGKISKLLEIACSSLRKFSESQL